MGPVAWLAVVAVLLTQWCAGRVCLAWIGPGDRAASGPRTLARALLWGPAAITLQMAAWHAVGIPFSLVTVLVPWWLVALLVRRRARPAPTGRPERAMLLAVALVTATSLWMALATPVHTADGLNNFALPARVFATHDDLAPERLAALSLPGHLEYPPLVALNASLFMRAAGVVDPGDPGLLAVKPFFVLPVLAFLLLAVELFFGRLRGAAAVAATLLACGIPTLLATPTAGMADLHLTAALLLLIVEGAGTFGRGGPGGARSLAPVVAAAGVCALTKDEGAAVAVVTAVALLVVALRPAGSRSLAQDIAQGAAQGTAQGASPALARGAALGGAVVLLTLAGGWRTWLAWHDIAYETTLAWPAGGLAAALKRVPDILAHFASLPWAYAPGGVSPWGLLWPVALSLAALALVRGRGRALLWPAVLLAAHLSLYVGVYAFNTQPLEWVLGNSAPRVFMHLLPWGLLLLAAALAPDFGVATSSVATSSVAAGPEEDRGVGARNRT